MEWNEEARGASYDAMSACGDMGWVKAQGLERSRTPLCPHLLTWAASWGSPGCGCVGRLTNDVAGFLGRSAARSAPISFPLNVAEIGKALRQPPLVGETAGVCMRRRSSRGIMNAAWSESVAEPRFALPGRI